MGIECALISEHNNSAEVLRPTLPNTLFTALKNLCLTDWLLILNRFAETKTTPTL